MLRYVAQPSSISTDKYSKTLAGDYNPNCEALHRFSRQILQEQHHTISLLLRNKSVSAPDHDVPPARPSFLPWRDFRSKPNSNVGTHVSQQQHQREATSDDLLQINCQDSLSSCRE